MIATSVVPPRISSHTLAPILMPPAPAPLPLSPIIEGACARIPPLWPLKNFVAVNPFVGLTAQTFGQTAQLMRRVAHHDIVMPAEFFRAALEEGQIEASDVICALESARELWPDEAQWLSGQNVSSLVAAMEVPDRTTDPVWSFADFLDAQTGSRWRAFAIEEVAKWCAAFYDEGQATWAMPWKGESLLAAWKSAAQLDCNPEIAGIRNFRALVAGLPEGAAEIIAHGLDLLGVSREAAEDFLHRQLMTVPGWSGAVQFVARENGMKGVADASLQELLAIRLAYDLALFAAFGAGLESAWRAALEKTVKPHPIPRDLLARTVFARALELGYSRELSARIAGAQGAVSPAASRPLAQAVFCIDVRSEVFRRALESASTRVETVGFAGFFGFAIEHVPFGHECGSAQCPVLLSPQVRIGEMLRAGDPSQTLAQKQRHKSLGKAWSGFKTSAVSSFSFVETAGLWSGLALIFHSLSCKSAPQTLLASSLEMPSLETMPLEAQVTTALGALRGMSLLTGFGRLVLLCGHGSETLNNPYGSGLDCGACGGHTGESNARVAALVFNNPQVRAGLLEHGVEIPDDTHFVAGLHNTTTDDVALFDIENVPPSHAGDLAELQKLLSTAAALTRRERATGLGIAADAGAKTDVLTRARARDWSQTRPEWGLAGNAAFIAAPRERTRALKLDGRTFLHSYDWKLDDTNAVLSLIMNAPMVVASWINLQYYASRVHNPTWGAGNKVIHNLVGKMGVAQGNGGDLQVGLPLQSLHDGQKWMHQPQRLSVFLEAPRARIQAVIAESEGVRDLVENEWLHLFAIEEQGKNIWRYLGRGQWKAQ